MTVEIDSSTPGKPFVRIQRIVIDYPTTDTARVEVTCQKHVPLYGGGYEPIGSPYAVGFEVLPHQMGNTFTLRNPQTGNELGGEMSNEQLMAGIFSRIVDSM